MNTPNKLTLLRMILVPVFLIVLLNSWEIDTSINKTSIIIAIIIFAVASATDYLDGYLARKNNQVTNFGKFLDPIADKLLVITAFIGLVQIGYCNAWVPVIVVARELAVTSIRLVANKADGVVISAGILGKLKTVSQIIAIIFLMVEIAFLPTGGMIGNIAIWISVLLTVISGISYLKSYWKYLSFE